MSDGEPIALRPRHGASLSGESAFGTPPRTPQATAFDRRELDLILALYGRKVAAGEWRDYAIDLGRETATFSVYRRASEWPLYRIEKAPRYTRRQGAYSVIAATGLILKRGHDLARVLSVLERRLQLIPG